MSEKIAVPLQIAKKSSPKPLRWNWWAWISRQEVVLFGLLLLVGLFLSLRTDTFFTSNNLSNVSRAFSWIAIAAFGQAIVIIIGGIDLSVGAVMALAGLVSAFCLQAGWSVSAAVAAGMLTGGLVGWINGTVISRVKLQPFIVTLGTMSIVRGIIFGVTGGWPGSSGMVQPARRTASTITPMNADMIRDFMCG